MKPKEKEFCRFMTVHGDPQRAAVQAGYKEAQSVWPELMAREDVAQEISRRMKNIRSIYRSTAVCGLYRLAYGDITDALTLLVSDHIGESALRGLDLACIAEIKRTDKSVEMKFCDRLKAIDRLAQILTSDGDAASGSSLIEAMMRSAEAIGEANRQVNDVEL